jgi:hypothetical protein
MSNSYIDSCSQFLHEDLKVYTSVQHCVGLCIIVFLLNMSLCNTLNIYVQHMPYDSIVSFITAQNSAHSCKCLYDRIDSNVNLCSLLYILINLAL